MKAGNELEFDKGEAPKPLVPNAFPVGVENMEARNGLAAPVASAACGLKPTPVVKLEENGVNPFVEKPPNPVG